MENLLTTQITSRFILLQTFWSRMQLIIYSWICFFSTSNRNEHWMPILGRFFFLPSLGVSTLRATSQTCGLQYLAVSHDPQSVWGACTQILHLCKGNWHIPVRNSPSVLCFPISVVHKINCKHASWYFVTKLEGLQWSSSDWIPSMLETTWAPPHPRYWKLGKQQLLCPVR